jgi:hypothetical protein
MDGPNAISDGPGTSLTRKISRRIFEPFIAIPIVAAILSGATGDRIGARTIVRGRRVPHRVVPGADADADSRNLCHQINATTVERPPAYHPDCDVADGGGYCIASCPNADGKIARLHATSRNNAFVDVGHRGRLPGVRRSLEALRNSVRVADLTRVKDDEP